MKALILETSTEKSCALLANQGKLSKKLLLPGGPELSKGLAFEVKKILDGETVDAIFVGQGPGSYTGIRVGAALAKGLSFGWTAPLYGFCSLKAFIPPYFGPFAVLVDAKMGGIYMLFGTRSKTSLTTEPARLIKLEIAEKLLQNTLKIVSPHPHLIQARLPEVLVEEATIDFDLLSQLSFSEENRTPLALSYLSSP